MPPASGGVPVTMGSSSFRSLDTGDFHLAEAWFPPDELLSRHTHDRASVAIMLDGSFDLEVPGRVHPDPAATDLLRPFAQVLDRVARRE